MGTAEIPSGWALHGGRGNHRLIKIYQPHCKGEEEPSGVSSIHIRIHIYIYMSPIPFGLMRLGFLSSIINTQANFCYTVLIFAYNDRNETTHQTHGIYYILYAIYRIVHTIHYISYIIYIYIYIWGVSLN